MAVRRVSSAGRAKMSAVRRGKRHPHRGVRPSAATRAKIGRSLRGKKHPHRGHPQSAATKARISASLKGRRRTSKVAGHRQSAATKAKISAALKGKKHPHKGRKASKPKGPKMTKARTAQSVARSAQLKALNKASATAHAKAMARPAPPGGTKVAGRTTTAMQRSLARQVNYRPGQDFAAYRAQLTARLAAAPARRGR